MTAWLRRAVAGMVLGALLVMPRSAAAYSVLAHETLVDALWDDVIVVMLRQRFPRESREAVAASRAFAYGGSVIQDLGYYPFGNHFFTNLLHYVRSGDFVETLVRESQTLDEYAFALGAMAHYAADNIGHPIATNRAVPLMYPKVRAKFGNEVTYVEDPKRHIMVEFAFDVAQVGLGRYVSDAYHQFIGFEVAKPLLERAFRQTYGLEMKDLFADEDLAIGTYRFAVSKMIPDLTRAAAQDKKDSVVYTFTRSQFETEFGTKYRRPSLFARFLVFVAKAMPPIGPFRSLHFDPPTPEAQRLFVESFARSRDRYRAMLEAARANRLSLPNTDFDTGRPTARGEYPLADETYAELVDKLAKRPAADVPLAIRRDIDRYYGRVTAAAN